MTSPLADAVITFAVMTPIAFLFGVLWGVVAELFPRLEVFSTGLLIGALVTLYVVGRGPTYNTPEKVAGGAAGFVGMLVGIRVGRSLVEGR